MIACSDWRWTAWRVELGLLTDFEWCTSYRHEDGDLIELFYNPALACAVQYDRMTGYFSGDALALASRGIDALIANDGRMRLIVGCTLQQPEQDAIGEGYDLRARLEAHLLAADLTPPDEAAGRGLEMVAWMVAQGHLDVKVAVPVDPDGRPAHAPGLYHEKVGILTDAEGNRLSFSGSINETAGGWVNNRESFHVHCGWFAGRETTHLEDEVDAFARLWEGREPIDERERINELLRRIAQLGTDSKARRLKVELETCRADGFDSAIVFTQYTDTMDYLRDYLADQIPGLPVASYSGKGGAWRDASGHWVPCSKEEIKRRLRDRQVRLLVCTDAAGEGLNLQFAGVLVNYDLPWNPMKVEQRIGRIDRLGQQRPVIRVLSFAYKDTVEQDVFFTVGSRINLFQGIVGRLQPILSRLPRSFEELALLDKDAREAARQRFLADLEQQVRDADEHGFDIDATVEASLDLPALPEPALTLRDLDRAIQIARARPPEVDFRPLDAGSYGIGLPGCEPLRVTTDAGVFEFSSDNFQLFSPGGAAFGAFCVDGTDTEAAGRGIAWRVQRPGADAEFVVATRFGPRTVGSFEDLLAALDVVGEPSEFPYADWPDVTFSVIA